MRIRILYLLVGLPLFFHAHQASGEDVFVSGILSENTREVPEQLVEQLDTLTMQMADQTAERPNPLLTRFRKKQAKHKKAVAAALAFPFPFGIVGLHRIYLGCAPYIPVVYIASLGGVFGILPLVDFCVILAEKDLEKFVNSSDVFMWVQ